MVYKHLTVAGGQHRARYTTTDTYFNCGGVARQNDETGSEISDGSGKIQVTHAARFS